MRWSMHLAPAALALVAVIGCDDDDELRVPGEHPYVRCLAAEPGEARAWSVGSLRFAREERTLRVEGLPEKARVALFTGPVDAGAVAALRESDPALALMVGAIGASEAEVARAADALAGLGAPVLFVAGGTDRYEGLEALEGDVRDRVIDITGMRSVRIGALELVPAAGAPDGRYAIADGACGLGEKDVSAIADAVGDAEDGVRRVLLTWAAPAGSPFGRGLAAVDGGSPLIADLAERIGAREVIAAWPRVHAGELRADPFCAVAPPLAGPWIRRVDGTREAPGATILTLSDGRLAPP